tara:strand:+ start:242 stop:577 length:336 start_codon:yes stop_codon:yes gene_type:complete
MNKVDTFDFIIHFIIGGLIIGGINFLSKYGKTKYVALIPAIPALGIYGLLLTFKNKKDMNEYLLSISNFILLSLVFYMTIFVINKIIKKIFISLAISLILWFIMIIKICKI